MQENIGSLQRTTKRLFSTLPPLPKTNQRNLLPFPPLPLSLQLFLQLLRWVRLILPRSSRYVISLTVSIKQINEGNSFDCDSSRLLVAVIFLITYFSFLLISIVAHIPHNLHSERIVHFTPWKSAWCATLGWLLASSSSPIPPTPCYSQLFLLFHPLPLSLVCNCLILCVIWMFCFLSFAS